VVVAVIAVRVVQMPADEIVDVIAVRNGLVPAVGSVDVAGLVLCAGRTAVRVLLVDGDQMLVDVALVRVMQVAAMQIIRMPIVADGDVAAVGPVLMVVAGVDRVIGFSHPRFLSSSGVDEHASPGLRGNLTIDHENHSQRGG
jgi:hypothetical protein